MGTLLGDDAELTAAVLAAQGGDENAFRAVYRAVHPRLLGYVRTLVGDGDAEDVTSEAWLQIARDLDSFTAGAAMESLSTGRTMALIAQLPQDQAEAVVLRVVVGLDAKSAAETLGKRPGAVRTAAHRGLKKLAELLCAEGAETGFGPDLDTGSESGGRVGHNADGQAWDGGGGRDLDAVPAQRGRGGGFVEQTGVTHSRWRTQKDM